ncbi:hypothetical protein BBK14_19800 [Parafrankia soli]|uniref:Uncharacterized protein n=1 Tax=Parafrankia soli TaxID=2599596 RepID=A0A1S1Q2A4_9ACTN|nr:hypothetical protein [Parafrankia soli]OHV27726.1 hypothetical protein BBK14_19800 [Parafrankia soli]
MTEQPYPNVLYSKEAATFMMAIAALQRANGMRLDDAIEYGIEKYWEYAHHGPHSGDPQRGSGDLDWWRQFMRAVGGPA